MDEERRMIEFTADDGEAVSFFVLEQIKIAGRNYILVSDGDNDGADAYILEEMRETDGQTLYEMIDDEEKLAALLDVFEETLDDVEIEMKD